MSAGAPRSSATRDRHDDLLVGIAVLIVAIAVMWFRYLPMIDLPQHHAMVSIIVHHDDPSWGFGARYTFDFLHRPYASVYLLAALLAQLVSLEAAMRVVVALCTVAPMLGLYALLRAVGRPRSHALLALPFTFGMLWHWGFLNFLLGVGLLQLSLAFVVTGARRPSRRSDLGLLLSSLAALVTHVHALFMLAVLGPVLAWGFRPQGVSWRRAVRAVMGLLPAVLGAGLFVLITWSSAKGSWAQINPGFGQRVRDFTDFLGAGMRAPWPALSLLGVTVLAGAIAAAALTDSRRPNPLGRRAWLALGAMFASQVFLYFVLPLNTNTATFVSGRHALLCVLFAIPLLPPLAGWRRIAGQAAAGVVAAVTLTLVISHLAGFDREARGFDRIVAAVPQNRRVMPLILDKGSRFTHGRTFPYLHFAGYVMAKKGGDLSRTFADVWNVPIRYRSDYARHVVPEAVEWNPRVFSPDRDLPHFDYVIFRAGGVPSFGPEHPMRVVVRSGRWSLLENPRAIPASSAR